MDRAPRHIRRLSHARALFAPLAGARTETAGVAYLADGGRVIALRFIAGGVDHVTVPPRTLTIDALAFGACGIILAHNHPSGDPSPSAHDLAHARRIARTLDGVDVRLVDHLIVTREATTSLRALGMV